jgi:hypothetical protein
MESPYTRKSMDNQGCEIHVRPPTQAPSSIHRKTLERSSGSIHGTCKVVPQFRHTGQALQNYKGNNAEITHPHRDACQKTMRDSKQPITNAKRQTLLALATFRKKNTVRMRPRKLD